MQFNNPVVQTTPLRPGDFVRLQSHRLALQESVGDLSSSTTTLLDKQQLVHPWRSSSSSSKANSTTYDRFIPSRQKINFEAANYYLTKDKSTDDESNENVLLLFDQVCKLKENWRKACMSKIWEGSDVLSGLSKTSKILSGTHHLTTPFINKVPGSMIGKPMEIFNEGADVNENSMWNSRPRMMPYLSSIDAVLEMPGFKPNVDYRLMDWGSKDHIALALDSIVNVYEIKPRRWEKISTFVEASAVSAVKWSNAENYLATCTAGGATTVYECHRVKTTLFKTKKLWSKFGCCSDHKCYIRTARFSETDSELVTGCTRGWIAVRSVTNGEPLIATESSNMGILTMEFSPRYHYLASSGEDMTVRIFLWPGLVLCMEIGYYKATRAVAWHPWETGVLFVGGGSGDGHISLWNVNTQKALAYRKINFSGSVEDILWDRHNAEIIVHWTYWHNAKRYSVAPVLASMDRIVDVLPTEEYSRVHHLMWNTNHTKIAAQVKNRIIIWDYRGNASNVKIKKNRNAEDLYNSPTKCDGFKSCSIR